MSVGRKAPEGIPQPIWDAAIEEWMADDTTIDNRQIKRIATRMMREAELAPDVLKRWRPDATESVGL